MTKDLTVGNPLKVIVSYMIPVFLGLVLQQAYNLVDTLVVGRFVGSNALGGVGSASSLCLMVMGATMGLCSGFCIPISHAFGEKNESKLRKYLAHAIYLSAANAVIIMAVFLTFGGQILDWMGTLPENRDFAYSYVMAICIMVVPTKVMQYCSARGKPLPSRCSALLVSQRISPFRKRMMGSFLRIYNIQRAPDSA